MFRRHTYLLVALALLLPSASTQAATKLPAPRTGYSLQFGDFDVYSLAVLNFFATGSNKLNSNDPYYVDSSPGKLVSPPDAVIATGPGGNAANNSGFIDDAYLTPDGTETLYYSIADVATDPNPGFTGDSADTWDAAISTLTGPQFLNGGNLVFFFNLNEDGSDEGLEGGDLLVFATVTLIHNVNTDGSALNDDPGLNQTFILRGTLPDFTYDDGGVNHNDWALTPSDLTINPLTGQIVKTEAPTKAEEQAGLVHINQNLGAQKAAFAAYSEALNTAVYSGQYSTMQVNLELGEINNGYEQLFIRAADIGVLQVVPEPTTLALWMGLSVMGLAANRFRKRIR